MALAETAEISHFRFRQLRKFDITQSLDESSKGPEHSVGLLAASNRFGFIFAGHSNGFRVVRLDTILSPSVNDDSKGGSRKVVSQFPSLEVLLPSDPFLLALNADEMTLAVGVTKGQCPVLLLFDIRTFLTVEPAPSNFLEVRLSSSPGMRVRDFCWNPSVVETFATCMEDGSAAIYEVTSANAIKILGNLQPTAGITSLSWSPKGKQLVVGRRSGHLSQYKPNLAECVKTIEPPAIFQNPVYVSSVLWLETHLFAAVYLNHQEDSQPSLVLVSVPKGASPSFLNFNDVCYGNGNGVSSKYSMHHLPTWRMLICSSSTALETAVVGCSEEKGPWLQWILEDAARAELPLVRNKETYPVGVAIITCAQQRIVISEAENYPPMPVLLLLSSEGQLCPFHMLHTGGAPSLVSAPEILSISGVRRPAFIPAPAQPLAQPQGILGQPVLMSTPVAETKMISDFGAPLPKTNLLQKFTEESPRPASLFAPLTKPEAQRQEPKPLASPGPLPPQQVMYSAPGGMPQGSQMVNKMGHAELTTSSGSLFRPANLPSGTSISPLPMVAANTGGGAGNLIASAAKGTRPTLTAVAPSRNVSKLTTQEGPKSSGDNTYIQAFLDEMRDFQREVDDLGCTLTQKINVGNQPEMSLIRKNTQDAIQFSSEIKVTLQSMQSDVNHLKSTLVETFALLEEARSRDLRDRDPVYLGLLRTRALDPCSQRQLKEMRRVAQYISGQLQEVHTKLDMDWQEQINKTHPHTRPESTFQSLNTVYQALANNLMVIDFLETALTSMMEQFKFFKDRSSSNQSFSVSDLSTTLGNISLSSPTSKQRHSFSQLGTSLGNPNLLTGISRTMRKPLDRSKENALRELIAQRPLKVIKAKPLADLSQSRLISALHTLQKSKAVAPRKIEISSTPVQVQVKPSSSQVGVIFPSVSITPIISAATISSTPKVVSLSQGLPQMSLSAIHKANSESAANNTIFSGRITQGQPFKPMSEEMKVPVVSVQSKSNSAAPTVVTLKNKTSSGQVPPVMNTQTLAASAISAFSATATPTVVTLKNKASSGQVPPVMSTQTSTVSAIPAFSATASSFSVTPFCAKPPLSGQPINFSFVSASNTTVQNVPTTFVPALTIAPNTVSPTFSFNLPTPAAPRIEKQDICSSQQSTEYENITPPETPQPVTITEISEDDSKVIEISLGGTENISPVVKVSNLSVTLASESLAQIQSPNSSSISTTATTFSFKQASNAFQTSPSGFSLDHLKTSSTSSGTSTSSGSVSTSEASTLGTSSIVSASTGVGHTFQFSNPTWGVSGGSAFSQPKLPLNPEKMVAPTSVISSGSTPPATIATSFQPVGSSFPSTPLFTTIASTAAVTFSFTNQMAETGNRDIVSEATPKPVVSSSPDSSQSSFPEQAQPIIPNVGDSPTVTTIDKQLPEPFQQPAPSTTILPIATSAFGMTTTVSTVPSFFSQSPFPTSTLSQLPTTTTTTTTTSVFSQPTSVFASSSMPITQTTPSALFGVSPATNSVTTVFSQPSTTTSPGIFGSSPATTSFNQSAANPQQVGLFSQNSFGQIPGSPAFGQPGQSVFGKSFGVSTFGQPSATPATFGSESGPFGQSVMSPQPTTTFGQVPTFGQANTFGQQSSFGQTKPVFGQTAGFGQSPSGGSAGGSPFSQAQPVTSTTPTQGGNLFNSNNFFMGLGGKPSSENAGKNVFGSTFGSPTVTLPSASLFGNQEPSTFGNTSPSVFSGSFSSGGSVAQAGFAAFQQTPPRNPGFGVTSSFGSAAVFSGTPTFGGAPGFGSPSSLNPTTAVPTFGSFGSSSPPSFDTLGAQSPTFGNLAQQQPPSPQQQQPQQQQPGQIGSPVVFGNPSGFGGQSPGAFGSQSALLGT